MEYLNVANGVPMLVLCTIVLLVVLAQPISMMIMAFKEGKKVGLSSDEMKKTVKSTAIFAIIPSMPVLASYLILVPTLGKYFPWLRLSVVGSVTYETTVAQQAAEAFGYSSIYDVDFPLEVFFSILLILTVCILGGNFFNLFFLKSYDQVVQKVLSKNAKFVSIMTGAIFVAMYSVFATPTVLNVGKPVGIITFLVTGVVSVIIGKASETNPKLKEYAFSLSLLIGMVTACIVNPLINSGI